VSTGTPPGGRAALLAAARAELQDHGHAGISLRAVARRAGVSHAAPKYHFPDRAALLTAIATEGFTALAHTLHAVAQSGPDNPLAALGRAYIDFGLAQPALYDLMFRPSELRADDPGLRAAQDRAIGELTAAVTPGSPSAADARTLTLTSWALVHGLVGLARDHALTGPDDTDPAATAHHLAEYFATRVIDVDTQR
jgi:AcrR family transcriptional regulator